MALGIFSFIFTCTHTIIQNENVNRTSTSERLVVDLRRPDRTTPMKVLAKKTFNFVDEIWRAYVQSRMNDLRYITDVNSNHDN